MFRRWNGGDGGIRTLDTLFKVCSFSKRVPSAARPRLHRPDMPYVMARRKSLMTFIVRSVASLLGTLSAFIMSRRYSGVYCCRHTARHAERGTCRVRSPVIWWPGRGGEHCHIPFGGPDSQVKKANAEVVPDCLRFAQFTAAAHTFAVAPPQ